MIPMFEIKYRDAMGRIGVFDIRGKKVETPLILPVINSKINQITPAEIKEMGFPGVIVNSYIIYREPTLREEARREGIHKFLDFDGVIMTDSGSFQLLRYGHVDVDALEIVEFQNAIDSDIGVILDIPTPPDASYRKALSDLEETISRGKRSTQIPRNMLIAGTIQGSTHPDLREMSAREMSKLNFDLYPIGGVVPLMESYRFSDLARVILHSKKFLPLNKPVHLFGAGHPMIFALAVALGCDIFDSAAYSLYAQHDRYITAEGTLHLEDLYEFLCPCEVCSNYTPNEIFSLERDEKKRLMAKHNLYATLSEIGQVKQSIYQGSLWELVQRRARNHPALLDALRIIVGNYTEQIERFDPVTKRSAFFYSGPESLNRPEVQRHLKKLKEIEFRAKNLVLLPDSEKPYSCFYGPSSGKNYHICIVSSVFGVIPLEIEEIYPLNQHERPKTLDESQIDFMQSIVKSYAKGFRKVFIHKDLESLDIEGEIFEDIDAFKNGDVKVKIEAMADYLFGKGAGNALCTHARAEFAKTGRIRRIYSDDILLATVRASDGFFTLTKEGAERIHRLEYPKNRVIIEDREVGNFIKEGRSVFAKFVVDCDPEIRPYQEVIVVDKEDNLLATGKAILNADEMLAFDRGIAVKVRRGIKIR